MQLHVTNREPIICAERVWHNKRLAIKMITETQQILACCQVEFNKHPLIKKVNGEPYQTPKHIFNHPVTKWARSDRHHAGWCTHYLVELYLRYVDQSKDSSCKKQKAMLNVAENCWLLYWQFGCVVGSYDCITFLNFAKSDQKKLDFTDVDDVFEAYDLYLKAQGV